MRDAWVAAIVIVAVLLVLALVVYVIVELVGPFARDLNFGL